MAALVQGSHLNQTGDINFCGICIKNGAPQSCLSCCLYVYIAGNHSLVVGLSQRRVHGLSQGGLAVALDLSDPLYGAGLLCN